MTITNRDNRRVTTEITWINRQSSQDVIHVFSWTAKTFKRKLYNYKENEENVYHIFQYYSTA